MRLALWGGKSVTSQKKALYQIRLRGDDANVIFGEGCIIDIQN